MVHWILLVMRKPPDRFTHALSVSVEKADGNQCRRPSPDTGKHSLYMLAFQWGKWIKTIVLSKVKKVIEARNRKRGTQFDAIFPHHRCPNCIFPGSEIRGWRNLIIGSQVPLKVKHTGCVIELVAMTSLSDSFYTYSGTPQMFTPSQIPARITPTPILMDPKAC